MKILGTLVLATGLSLAAALPARAADVWLLDIVTVQATASGYLADSYLGALDLLARRHGGVRVSRFHESTQDDQPVRRVGLWRFPTTAALAALVNDPSYVAIRRLRQTGLDADVPQTLQLLADRSPTPR